jgi:transposase
VKNGRLWKRRVRVWRRDRAILLLAEAGAAQVAPVLSCSRTSVDGWAKRWRTGGVVGLHEPPRAGRPVRLAGDGTAVLVALIATDPRAHGHQATGWTVPLLREQLVQSGYAVSERTVRRALHRLGWRWKRPKSVFGRPDPEYEAKRGRSSREPRRC